MMIFRYCLLFINLFFTLYVFCSEDSLQVTTRSYTATWTDKPPRIDGILDDPCWDEGTWASDFIQQQPYEGQPASFPTEINIQYNTNYLFVAIRCYDGEPEKIRRIFGSRDAFTGDVTGIALDSYNDNKTAFEFNLTAAGQKIDLKHKGDFEFDQNWNAVWNGKTALEDSAWTAEFQIPFSQLRYSNKDEQVWGMHVWRWLDRRNEESQWKLIPINAPAMVYLFGDLNGIKNIRTSRQVELAPYAVMKYQLKPPDERNPYGQTKDFFPNVGFDAKIGLSSNFTLDATINPDFGQVEADPSVLNLTAFETFYEEKRPFFLEGNEIFDFSLDDDKIYHSRRIGRSPEFITKIEDDSYMYTPENTTILGAAKISGKTSKGLSVGILESLTSAENASVYLPGNENHDTLISPYTNFVVARLMQEKNGANTIIGGIFTATNKFSSDTRIESLTNSDAYSGGFDFEQNFNNKTYFISGKMLMSYVSGTHEAIRNLQESSVHLFQRPDANYLSNRYDSTLTYMAGTGGQVMGGKKGGKWRYQEKLNWRSPGFELNDLGYLKQADVIGQTTTLEYIEHNPKKFSRNYLISLFQSLSASFGGELIYAAAGINMENQFHNLWGIQFNWNAIFPSFDTRELRGGPALWMNARHEIAAHLNSNQSKNLSFNGGIHYDPVQNEDSRNIYAHLNINWYPISRIRLSPYVLYSDKINEYQYIQTIDTTADRSYLMGRLEQKTLELTFRAELFLTPEVSLQFYGSPYFSSGNYAKYYFVNVNEADSRITDERYTELRENYSFSETVDNDTHLVEYISGNSYTFDNPDFSFAQFRSNLVFRWEYRTGSVLYLVWSHNKTFDEKIAFPELSDSISNLGKVKGNHIFLIKLNYWFSI